MSTYAYSSACSISPYTGSIAPYTGSAKASSWCVLSANVYELGHRAP